MRRPQKLQLPFIERNDMTDNEFRTLLEQILDTQHKCVTFEDESTEKSKLSRPATDQELDQLSAHFEGRELRLPPSYRQFLKISNGVSMFRWDESFSLRSAAELIELAETDERWAGLCKEFDDVGPVHRFIIGSGDLTTVCAFDPDTIDENGEMKLLEFDIEANPPTVHDNLEAFFRLELERHQEDLALELEDRADLEDD
jgi:hypothetical protein